MGWEQIASGSVLDADNIGEMETYIAEGQKTKLELDLRWELPSGVVDQIRNQLASRGIPGLAVYSNSPMLVVEWQKGFPWLPVVVGAVLGLIAVAILVLAWRLFVEVESLLPEEFRPLLGIAILSGLGLLVWNYGKETFKRGGK